ncbi:uncharacterized protein F4807DRAFT_464310 [Annulohypoxylon truncatum]|uniref:uncharacterized protein n=1 Tax=Annulohypoxylon truncatum TaxID=327061 RepID=UPI0020085C05|nr:uncharacterized protein F4807DRAFT_464310 [Annulohypoxylon truncatum]KAI1205848.1 hypothetical protein F4807DRAFT_464310 [Annulohypoxylon truncatum]
MERKLDPCFITSIFARMTAYTACRRFDSAHMSPFERLPPELKLQIFNYCDPLCVLNAALTGPALYAFVEANESRIARSIICGNISPDLRCLAAARYRADHYGFPVARSESGEPQTFGRQFFTRKFVRDGLRDDKVFEARNEDGFYANFKFTLEIAHKLISFDHTVLCFAYILGRIAMHKGPLSTIPLDNGEPMAPDYVTHLSPGELHRFMKALYIFEVASAVLPFVDVPDVTNQQYAIWHNFWEQFPPWELQQVRCVQRMLQDWVDDLVTRQGGYLTIHPDEAMLGQFVIQKGLVGLRELEIRPGWIGAVQNRIAEFSGSLQMNTLPLRTEIWMKGMDEFWMPYDQDFDEVGLNATIPMNWSDEEDSGPRDAWLHTLLENRVYDKIFRAGYFLQFSCEPCMTRWGFVFWDRAKLEWHSQETMPTAEQMMDVAGDTFLPREIFQFAEWGRQGGICPGCVWSARVSAEEELFQRQLWLTE